MDAPIRSRVSAYALATTPGPDGTAGPGERILLTRLAESSPVFAPGLWHLPGGGVDPGEQPADTLVRELAEETGLRVLDARLLDARGYTAHRLGVSWHLVALFYRVVLSPGDPAVVENDGSTAEAAWLPLADLTPAILSPAAADGLRMLDGAAGRAR
ncbi:NUDIX hydrolase [Streptomyces palmae]|uniref:NUDIX domain-containing protein n=1 Tax=Streptomyces palmae TaxID=1701085 RepID=A0A4Z0GQN2_9ACTN|nr:NUDIX domain-containing protein [Streptomyces palmae]TGA98827.1 NUDIX domain-containing protein [Streptomyces palmae]